jgi:hypothetical protein
MLSWRVRNGKKNTPARTDGVPEIRLAGAGDRLSSRRTAAVILEILWSLNTASLLRLQYSSIIVSSTQYCRPYSPIRRLIKFHQ